MSSSHNRRADLLIELGCEELPARLIQAQLDQLAEGLGKRLADAGLIDSIEAERFATPRRLAVRFSQVLEGQADRMLDRTGPAEQVALDAEGQPTPAALGFARSVGKAFEELDWLETDQGRRLHCRVEERGAALAELLGPMLEETVREMASARSMRWSDQSDRFLRPIRWLVALHGEEVIALTLAGLTAGRLTQGHRIHAPGQHEIARASDYERTLESAYVLVDPESRRSRIAAQAQALATEAELTIDDNPALVDENAGLTEWPVAVMGSFDPEFLEVPEEALISSMQQHQKCFPLRRPDGRLAPRFLAIANIESEDIAAMRAGFERVIRPRLSDARFFWDQDGRTPLAERIPRLDGILFEDTLGSIGDKSKRLQLLSGELAAGFGADPESVRRAAALCKCDLVTDMVGEFPELQGIMGRYYAEADGEPAAVARAIEEHYMPRQAGAALPEAPEGRALALADRLDSIVGPFAVGKKPRGSKDPFALRRAALGVVRILDQSRTSMSLQAVIAASAEVLSPRLDVPAEVVEEVLRFLNERLRSHAMDAGLELPTIQAAEAGRMTSVADFMARAQAIQQFSATPEAESLVAAYKRASNLLKQVEERDFGEVRSELLKDDAEKALFDKLNDCDSDLQEAIDRHDYPAALETLAGLRSSLDGFFDRVMVMVDDAALRDNRLALLARLRRQIADIADLARLGR
jgi:glycyl-tRNA synthetase beta chain